MIEIPKWRWHLVDSLAHGRAFWPVHMKLSDPDSDGSLILEVEEAMKSGSLPRMKQIVQKARERLDKMLSSFSKEESKRALQTPRFDISDAVFLKSDVPYERWDEYVKSLPALCVPFSEFWMTWAWRDEDRAANTEFASHLRHTKHEDGSSTLNIQTYIDLPSKGNISEKEEIILRIEGDLELDDFMKGLKINTKESDIIMFVPLLHSLALLGCRNVKTVEVNPPRQIRRRTQQTHGVALCSYRVVIIGNGKSANYSHHEGGGKQGVSICRGHFKTYDEHGLFGNRKGTWWWQNHARGNYESGVVVRDYVVTRKEIPTDYEHK